MSKISFKDFDLNLNISNINFHLGYIDLFGLLKTYHPDKDKYNELSSKVFFYRKAINSDLHKHLFYEYLCSLLEDLFIYRNYKNKKYQINSEEVFDSYSGVYEYEDNLDQDKIKDTIKKHFINFHSSLYQRVSHINSNICNLDMFFNEDNISIQKSGISFSIDKQLIDEIISEFEIYFSKINIEEIDNKIKLAEKNFNSEQYFKEVIPSFLKISSPEEFIESIENYAQDFEIIKFK